MGEKQNVFEGVTITLKKRKLSMSGDDLGHTDKKIPEENYVVWGHFDQMTIKYIDDWSKWAPYHTETISLKDEYMDKYNIKAYFPEQTKRIIYQSYGFDYQIWRDTKAEYPFIITSVVNISDEYARMILKAGKTICDAFSELTLECMKEGKIEEKWPQMHCVFLPTIGFSDFVLMFKTAELKSVLDLIELLKQKMCGRVPCLSNAYTMIGFCERGLDKLTPASVGGIKLAIRFCLKDGVAVKDFYSYFASLMGNKIEKSYAVLGDADFMIVSDIELKQVMPLYFKNTEPGIFHPEHDIFKYYIRSMQSEIRVNVLDTSTGGTAAAESREEKNIEDYKNEYLELIEKLKDFMGKNKIPGRVVYGIQIVMKRFLQLIQSRHCFDMEYIVGNAFFNFAKCIEKNIEIIDAAGDEEKYSEIQEMLDAMNRFREKIGDYLADMQRSDSLFLEGRSLSHPSIGSATKLLFFYNGYIECMKEALCPQDREKYRFVVTSGGTDQTQAIDLFAHLDPADAKACSVILMTVPEASLYDIKSSLFHVQHELLHFCGERLRKQRVEFILDAVSGYTAVMLGDFFEREQRTVWEPVLSQMNVYMSPAIRKEVENESEGVFGALTDQLKRDLKKLIYDRVQKELTDREDEAFYYGRYIYAKIYEILEEKVFYTLEDEKRLEFKIYHIFTEYRYDLLRNLRDILCKNNILYSNIEFTLASLEKRMRQITDKKNIEYETQDMIIIRCIIALYFGREVQADEKEIFIAEEDSAIDLDTLLLILQHLFKECYADCMGGKILETGPADFLFSFLTEKRNERYAFSTDIVDRLRIIADLQYLYGIKNDLSDDTRKELESFAQKSKGKNIYNIQADSLIAWIQKIIRIEGQEERIEVLINPILKYLRACQKKWGEEGILEKLEDFERLNQCSGVETPEDTYEFLHCVADNWIHYAEQKR